MNRIQIYINNVIIDKPQDSDIGLRLQKFIEDDYELTQRGGDYSLTLNLPITKTNELVFGNKSQLFQYRKFGETIDYPARIELDGNVLFEGVYRLNKVSRMGYQGEFAGIDVDWLKGLDSLRLRNLGYVDGVPTWTVPFTGMNDANAYNIAFDKDIVFPDISYNNVPVTDYLDYNYNQIFGDASAGIEPLDLPYDMPTRTAHWSWRFGSTFEDFPPAVKYEAIVRAIFREIGYDVKGDIFRQEWFKRIILPYTGDGYIWNYKTLAYLYIFLLDYFESYGGTSPVSVGLAPNTTYSGLYSGNFQIGVNRFQTATDFLPARVDRIANFKKWGVTDRSIGYVVPENGIYKIRIKSRHKTEIQHNTGFNTSWLNIGQGEPGRAWDNQMLLVVRENQNGDYALNPEWQKDVADYFAGINDDFITNQNDVIGYVIPKQYNQIGTLPDRRMALGSPVQDWQEEPVVTISNHTILTNTFNNKAMVSECEFEITVQLRKNERVHFYWMNTINLNSAFTPTATAVSMLNEGVVGSQSEAEIENLCSTEEIDISRNLPDLTAKDFITSFIRLFNLTYTVDNVAKSVNFNYNRFRDGSESSFVDVTDAVDALSIEMRPVKQPEELRLGYENDKDDRLLTTVGVQCDEENRELLEYGNVILENDSVYGEGKQEIRLPFSATKFTKGVFDTVDIVTSSIFYTSTFNDPQGNPFDLGLAFIPDTRRTYTWQVPNIQSQEHFEQVKVGDLEYNWNYKPRLLYFFGVPQTSHRFLVGAPSDAVVYSDYWKLPTVCGFDNENAGFNNGIFYPSLRFDRFLYSNLFYNQKEIWRDSFVLKADIKMNARLWNELKPTQRVVYNNDVYRLLTIEDYDVSGNNLASITLLKLI